MKRLAALAVAGLLIVLSGCYGPPSTSCSANECRVSFSKQYQIDASQASGDSGYLRIAVDYLCLNESTWRRTWPRDVLTTNTTDGDTIVTQVYCPSGINDAHGVDHA